MHKTKTPLLIGADHAGFKLKESVKKFLEAEGYSVHDCGATSEKSTDYPDYAHELACKLEKGESKLGIILCGSGNGVAITANKHRHIRAALCWIPELAYLARAHNDANVLALPARFVDEKTAAEIVQTFLNTSFEGGRHSTRVKKIGINKTCGK